MSSLSLFSLTKNVPFPLWFQVHLNSAPSFQAKFHTHETVFEYFAFLTLPDPSVHCALLFIPAWDVQGKGKDTNSYQARGPGGGFV